MFSITRPDQPVQSSEQPAPTVEKTQRAPKTISKNKVPSTATTIVSGTKRGRKGNNITNAFAAIPSSPVSAETFATQHNVSIAVLRQSKRFDTTGLGPVNVRKDKSAGTLMIWRESK